MSNFLDELLEDLAEEPTNDLNDETETDDAAEDEAEDGEAEEIAEVEDEVEASTDAETEVDDETELTPVERKAYGRLKALQDERTKRQSAEAERDALNSKLAEMQRQRDEAEYAKTLPDPHDDPIAYVQAIEQKYQQDMLRQSLGHSIERAVAKYGETEVETAAKWFESQIAQNPHMPLQANMLSQTDQMEYVVNSYKQATKMSAIASGDYSALIADLQKAGYNISKAAPADVAPAAPAIEQTAPPSKPAAPKRSKLASTTGATTAPPKQASMMDDLFRR